MRPGVALTTFAVVFPAELPDKTTLASLVLAARYRPGPVWVGAAAAFLVQGVLAVTAGGLLALLPDRAVALGAAVLFATGAVLAARGSADDDDIGDTAPVRSARRIALVTFGVLFLAEFGDFTQLATASLAARYDAPVEVLLGAWLALVSVCGIAVVAGQNVLRVVPLRLVRLVASGLFATVAVLSFVDALS